jgi:endonuclease/exonuclease/phosphatase family metal-dependent hydrolase
MKPEANPKTFSLLSLNTFALPFYLGTSRLKRLMRILLQQPVDVFCFQEIQQNTYIPLVRREMKELYPFFAFGSRHLAPKGGLLTLAKVSVENQSFVAYPDRGRPFSIGFADWALEKGVLRTEFEVNKQPVVVMNTHLHANYLGNWSNANFMVRIQTKQVQYLASLVRAEAPNALVILCGDFNFPRHAFLYEELLSQAGLVDVLADDPRPTYIPFPLVPETWNTTLDYLLIRYPENSTIQVQPDILRLDDQAMRRPHQRFLTDHCALTLQVTWKSQTDAVPDSVSRYTD